MEKLCAGHKLAPLEKCIHSSFFVVAFTMITRRAPHERKAKLFTTVRNRRSPPVEKSFHCRFRPLRSSSRRPCLQRWYRRPRAFHQGEVFDPCRQRIDCRLCSAPHLPLKGNLHPCAFLPCRRNSRRQTSRHKWIRLRSHFPW